MTPEEAEGLWQDVASRCRELRRRTAEGLGTAADWQVGMEALEQCLRAVPAPTAIEPPPDHAAAMRLHDLAAAAAADHAAVRAVLQAGMQELRSEAAADHRRGGALRAYGSGGGPPVPRYHDRRG